MKLRDQCPSQGPPTEQLPLLRNLLGMTLSRGSPLLDLFGELCCFFKSKV